MGKTIKHETGFRNFQYTAHKLLKTDEALLVGYTEEHSMKNYNLVRNPSLPLPAT